MCIKSIWHQDQLIEYIATMFKATHDYDFLPLKFIQLIEFCVNRPYALDDIGNENKSRFHCCRVWEDCNLFYILYRSMLNVNATSTLYNSSFEYELNLKWKSLSTIPIQRTYTTRKSKEFIRKKGKGLYLTLSHPDQSYSIYINSCKRSYNHTLFSPWRKEEAPIHHPAQHTF